MAGKMTVMGTGPKTAVPAFSYLVLMIVLDQITSPRFRMPGRFQAYLPWGAALIAVGLLVLGLSSVQLVHAFRRHELATTGWYAIAPNPMFMSYVLFILPGLALLLRSWLVLTTVVVFYILIRVFARAEDEWLLAEFGERFIAYRRKVLLKFL
jgi:protein-S-isoprenylcysteine O-methyltransferase Ste14